MEKKTVIISVVISIFAIVGTTTFLLVYPYNPKFPPILDDNGSTRRGVSKVVDANNQFALDLYLNLSETEDGNIFFSPYSMFSALAMTYEGALGSTQEEIQNLLHFPTNDVLRPNFAALYNRINQETDDYTLRNGNALWGQEDYPFNESYINLVKSYYGGKIANLDFIHETERSREIINTFIDNQTNGKIDELLPAGSISELTRLVLTNAIYFAADWKWQFEQSNTANRSFSISPNEIIQVPTMHLISEEGIKFNYLNRDNIDIIELPYNGDQLSMLIMVPYDGINTLETSLTSEKIKEYRKEMSAEKFGDIYMPMFEFKKDYSMKNYLSSMGMSSAFNSNADFSGMTNLEQLYIDKVFHQAYVKVDEEGTEATAATAIVMEKYSAGGPRSLSIDRPFIFLIQEQETGAILFLGSVSNPSQK